MVQENVDKELMKAFETDAEITFIRARAGAGKTYLSVAYALYRASEGDRVAIFVRTRSEINQALRIAREIRSRLGDRAKELPTMIPMTGKEALCRFPPENNAVIKWWCRIIDCEFLNHKINDEFRDLIQNQQFSSIREYFIQARDMHLCPYFALQLAASEHQTIIVTHPYLINDELFERLGERDILIIDEAHNLLKPITARINARELKGSLRDLNDNEIQNMIINLWRRGDRHKAMKISRVWSFTSSPGEVIRINHEYIKVLPPDELIRERMRAARKIFVISSTLYPINMYKKLFARNIKAEIKIIPGFLRNTKTKIHVILKIGLTSRYKERSEKTFRMYAKVIQEIVNKLNKTTLVFVPSKEFASNLYRELRWTVVLDETDLYQIESEHVISVMGSKISEGVDISIGQKEPELVIIAGLPYPRRDKEYLGIINLYTKYYKIDARTLLTTMETSEMLSRLIQTAGRVGRKKKGAVIIIDDRITSIPIKIPIYSNIKELIASLRKFFEKSHVS